MARGSCIVITALDDAMEEEGFVATGQTFYPGLIVIRDTSVALKGGRWTYKIYDETNDGDMPTGSFWVVTEKMNAFQGLPITTAIAAGGRVHLHSPKQGEELNLLVKNLSGTTDDHAIGEKMIVDTGSGMLIATTGTPETEVAQLLEAITDPVADTLAWCQWGGG